MAQVDQKEWPAGENNPAISLIEKPERVTRDSRALVRLAWVLMFLSIAIYMIGVVLMLLVPQEMRGINSYTDNIRFGFIELLYTTLGMLIAARHPKNPIGWYIFGIGIGRELSVFAIGYVTYANYNSPNSLPTYLVIFTILYNLVITQHTFTPITLLSFPDGKFVSPRWRLFAYSPMVLSGIFYLFTMPQSVAKLPDSLFRAPVQLILPNLDPGFVMTVADVLRPFFGIFIVIGAIGLVRRLGTAHGDQREQLKWSVYFTALSAACSSFVIIIYSVPFRYAASPTSPSLGMFVPIMLSYVAYALPPIGIFIAIFKYRLYDIDLIINRTLVYVPLTGILGGLYSASITLFQKLFIASTGQRSDAAIVMSTLVLASAFTPLKNSLQTTVDKRFKEPKDPLKELRAFGKQIEAVAEVINTRRTVRRLLEMSILAVHASCGAVYLMQNGELKLVNASPGWEDGCGVLSLPMDQDGVELGVMLLGPRGDQKGYTAADRKTLQQAVDRVAEMVWLTQTTVERIMITGSEKISEPIDKTKL